MASSHLKGGKSDLSNTNMAKWPRHGQDPYLPAPGSQRPGRDLRPPPGGGQGTPGDSEGGRSGRAKEETAESTVEMFLLDHRTHPRRPQPGAASSPSRGV